ncbi:MAG: hypothetical protein KJ609_11860 [Gammaproteobacteria bacterium]|nr:hypothetical protein [Gammaproteobacteria bacterium]MBU2023457.1 hypothetical protein [Gammaproteobacteria bacterium]MBU2237389.1 hypothetical protein [Gammaproteobacteria bacterium]MBU2319235.1 hypothetical protein [Gammaproteobacteria bacterium]MBU2412198.1 hypothetical protein [Gammaproteobacteria bacterium]
MPVVNKHYEELSLKDVHLKDPLLMALAWKKSHQYIRTTNWYADNFELDLSALNLVQYCNKWVASLAQPMEFSKLELVPAPKTSQWEFVETKIFDAIDQQAQHEKHNLTWQPKPDEKNYSTESPLKIRPLARISIREQSVMTLLMMGLANKVETAQGNPDTPFNDVHEKGIVSYGNRLYCQYQEDGQASHSYGATTIYSKYFIDYRRFLERPYYFATQQLDEISPDECVYLIELDLSKFFDLINRDLLITKIKGLIECTDQNLEFKCLDNLLSAFQQWEWTEDGAIAYEDLCKSDNVPIAPKGLPQGLVAAGFLSNVYMLEFDDQFQKYVGKCFSNKSLRLVDYCRYVDDIRLVVVGPKSFEGKDRINIVTKAVNKLVKCLDCWKSLKLELNSEKTKVEIFYGRKVGVSKNLEEIQSRLSGPISLDEAENQLGQLESLLSLSNEVLVKAEESSFPVNLLANIENKRFDLREDTLKRFAANKLVKVLNEMRHFTTQEPDDDGHLQPGDWDYLQERIARRFIACWSYDPALVLLLKKGLELFPCTKLLEPVLQQLDMVMARKGEAKQIAVAEYCLSEVYRHAATTIHKKEKLAIPAHANVNDFFELLQAAASKHCELKVDNKFSLLSEQARFLLLVRGDSKLATEFGDEKYDLIIKLLRGFRDIPLSDGVAGEDIAVSVLMASQICGLSKEFIRATSCLLEKLKSMPIFSDCIELLIGQDKHLALSLIRHARGVKQSWHQARCVVELANSLNIDIKPLAKSLDQIETKVSLLGLIIRDDNPFSNEVMALKLMQSALGSVKFLSKKANESIDLAATKVKFLHFSPVVKKEAFDANLELTFQFKSKGKLDQVWGTFSSTVDDDIEILRSLGEFTRAALVGSQDWTAFGQTFDSRVGYRGIRTSAFKRQLGLMTTPESISGVGAQVSGWLTGLISKLLKWPGISVNDHGYKWPALWTVDAVAKLVSERLALLKQAYCTLSGMPSLIEKQTLDWSKDKKTLSVVMVQSKMPLKKDFSEFGLMLDDFKYRSKHRKHIASVAELVLKHLEAQNTDDNKKIKKHCADLIVWPELAIHNDDLDVLVALSRKTKAIVFAGIGFITQVGIKGPNNCAVWIVPTKHQTSQREIIRLQGKHNMMADEVGYVEPWRPYQLLLELVHPAYKDEKGFILTGSVCFDATDIALSADLRDKSNAYLVSALNQDVNTFDSMVEALHYHMYQHVVLVNSGEFGGSFAKAPYKDAHKRLIAHVHGNNHISINTFEMNMFDFRRDGVGKSMQSNLDKKAAPAGV